MQKDLSWLGQLSKETLEAIDADLSRSDDKPEEQSYVTLINGEKKPGRYSIEYNGKTRAQVFPGESSEEALEGYIGAYGGVGKRWLPIWDVKNDCIVHVPEVDKPYYLGRMPNSPRRGSYIDILPEGE